MILDLLVTASEALRTELHDLLSLLDVLHDLLAALCHEHICQELQADSLIVLGYLVVSVLHVLG